MINCPYKRTVYFMGEIMSYVVDVLIITLFISGLVRHIIRTLGFILEYRLKVENRRLERFKH